MKKISFITVNFNSGDKVCALIDSIRSNAKEYEIIVVDNASSDNSRDLFDRISGHDLRCIYNSENVGYGQANNIGVKEAVTEIIVLINPDAFFRANFSINDFFIRNLNELNVGMVAPLIIYPDGTPQPNFAHRYSSIQTFVPQLLSLGKFFRWLRSHGVGVKLAEILGQGLFGTAGSEYLNRFGAVSERQSCAWVSGACIGMRKSTFAQLGGFDDRFFLYSEDEDLCRRVKAISLIVQYDPSLSIVHEVGGTHTHRSQVGHLGWGELHRLQSGLTYLSKYRSDNWRMTKFIYVGVATIRLFFGFYFFISPLKSIRLFIRLLKI